jgi:WD40 repeat protein
MRPSYRAVALRRAPFRVSCPPASAAGAPAPPTGALVMRPDRSLAGSPSVPHSALPIVWSRHVDDYVTTLTGSPDGALVAVGTSCGDVHVLDAATGDVIFKHNAHPGGVCSLKFSPVSCLLATCGQDGYGRLFDDAGALCGELSGGGAWVEQLAWAPDGTQLVTTSGQTARVWSKDGRPVFETETASSTLTGVAWNSQGTQLATASQGGVRVFDGRRGKPLMRLPWKASLISLAWSPNDAIIACGTEERSVHFWRLDTGKDSEISGFASNPRALSWDRHSELLATAGAPLVSVWPFSGKGPERRDPILLRGHEALCTVLSFHPEQQRLATGGDDAGVLIWSPSASAAPIASTQLYETVTALTWLQPGRLLVASDSSGYIQATFVGS